MPRYTPLGVFVLFAIPLATLAAQRAEANSQALADRVDRIVRQSTRNEPFAGMSIGVAKDGKIVFAKGYGYANLEHRIDATKDTVYHIDSITKHLSAGAAMKLIATRKLSLESDIGAYVPEFEGRNIQLRHLLNHTSGLKSYTSIPEFLERERLDLSHPQMIDLIRKEPPEFAAGTSWRYCNSGFYLLGLAMEKAAGKPYRRQMEELFQSLGMKDSCYGENSLLIRNRAQGYEFRAGKPVNANPISWDPVFAGGAICSTVSDLLKWELALEAGKIVSKSQLRQITSPSKLRDGAKVDYGSGTRLGSIAGHALYGHTGSGAGFKNVLITFPADRLAIVVLQNSEGGVSSTSVARQIAEEMLHFRKSAMLDLLVPADLLSAMAGTYSTEEGIIEIFAKSDRLRFRPAGVKGEGMPLFFQGGRTFRIDDQTEIVADPTTGWQSVYSNGIFMEAAKKRGA